MPRMKAERTAVDTEKVRSRIQTDIGRHVGQARNIAYRSFLRVLCEPPLDTIAPRQIALVPLEDVDLGCPPEPRIPTNDAAVLINEPNDLAPCGSPRNLQLPSRHAHVADDALLEAAEKIGALITA